MRSRMGEKLYVVSSFRRQIVRSPSRNRNCKVDSSSSRLSGLFPNGSSPPPVAGNVGGCGGANPLFSTLRGVGGIGVSSDHEDDAIAFEDEAWEFVDD